MTPQKRDSAKNCPECGQPLTQRTNRNNGSEFLGCSDWPNCTPQRESAGGRADEAAERRPAARILGPGPS